MRHELGRTVVISLRFLDSNTTTATTHLIPSPVNSKICHEGEMIGHGFSKPFLADIHRPMHGKHSQVSTNVFSAICAANREAIEIEHQDLPQLSHIPIAPTSMGRPEGSYSIRSKLDPLPCWKVWHVTRFTNPTMATASLTAC